MNDVRLTGPAASVYVGGLMRNHAGVNASKLWRVARSSSPARLRRLLGVTVLRVSRRTLARWRRARNSRPSGGRVGVLSIGRGKPRPRSTGSEAG